MNKTIIMICLYSLLTACGADIAYKRGANARDYQASKQTCSDAKTEAALKACLEEKGWAVQKLDNIGLSDEELFASASYNDDNRTSKTAPLIETTEDIASEVEVADERKTSETIKTEIVETPETRVTAKAVAPVAVETEPKKPYHQTLPGPAKSGAGTPPPTTTKQKIATVQNKPKVKAKPNMMDTYVIKSWWKMGGNLTMLEGHMDACRADLGEAHYPNKKTFTFTRGFAICMRQHGWKGLVEKKS